MHYQIYVTVRKIYFLCTQCKIDRDMHWMKTFSYTLMIGRLRLEVVQFGFLAQGLQQRILLFQYIKVKDNTLVQDLFK